MLPVYLLGDPALLDERFPLPLAEPFTTAEALAQGVTRRDLTRLVRDGFLRRPVKGVYVAAPQIDAFKFRGHDRLRNALARSGERWLVPSDVVPLQGDVCVTIPLRTAWDLGRLTVGIVAIGGMDALARAGSFTVDELVAGVERFRRQRGVVQLRELAPIVDPRAESVGESSVRLRWRQCPGLPGPELQIPVLDPSGCPLYWLDLGVQELRLGVEYDGEQWHSDPEDRAHDFARRTALEDVHRFRLDVFRREHVFGQGEIVTQRLPIAVREARDQLARPSVLDLGASREERWRR